MTGIVETVNAPISQSTEITVLVILYNKLLVC